MSISHVNEQLITIISLVFIVMIVVTYCTCLMQVLSKTGTPEQMDIFSFLDPQCTSGTKTETSKKGTERNCVKLRGLPWESTAEDVIEFFDDMSKHIELHGVHMVLNSQVRYSVLYQILLQLLINFFVESSNW